MVGGGSPPEDGGGGGRSRDGAGAKAGGIPPYMKAMSGSMGGIVEASCLQPIDVIKTRLQLDRTGTYKGIAHCGSTVCKTEGVRALWKGLTPFATHLTLKYALRMGSNALFQSAFKDSDTGVISQQGRIMSGFGAGVLEALVIVTPFEARFSLFPQVSAHSTNFGVNWRKKFEWSRKVPFFFIEKGIEPASPWSQGSSAYLSVMWSVSSSTRS